MDSAIQNLITQNRDAEIVKQLRMILAHEQQPLEVWLTYGSSCCALSLEKSAAEASQRVIELDSG